MYGISGINMKRRDSSLRAAWRIGAPSRVSGSGNVGNGNIR